MEKEFLEKINDVLDCENPVSMDSVLKEVEEWDSLSLVAFLAMANAQYNKQIVAADIRAAKTVRDLYNFIK